MDLSVIEGLKMTCILVETCHLCNKTNIVVPDIPLLYFISTKRNVMYSIKLYL